MVLVYCQALSISRPPIPDPLQIEHPINSFIDSAGAPVFLCTFDLQAF